MSGLFHSNTFQSHLVVAYISVVHYFLLLSSIQNLFIHLLVDGYFQFLSTTVNICIQSLCRHMFSFILSKYQGIGL